MKRGKIFEGRIGATLDMGIFVITSQSSLVNTNARLRIGTPDNPAMLEISTNGGASPSIIVWDVPTGQCAVKVHQDHLAEVGVGEDWQFQLDIIRGDGVVLYGCPEGIVRIRPQINAPA